MGTVDSGYLEDILIYIRFQFALRYRQLYFGFSCDQIGYQIHNPYNGSIRIITNSDFKIGWSQVCG